MSPQQHVLFPDAREAAPAELLFSDVSLREGEQCEGVSFPVETKLDLARELEAAGVGQIQVGFPGRYGDDLRAARRIQAALTRAQVEVVALAFVPDWEQEIDDCLRSEADVVNVVVRASPRLQRVIDFSPDDALRRVSEAVGRATAAGSTVAFTPSDATRADLDFLVEIWRAAVEAGASRIYVADSIGVATPELVTLLVQRALALGVTVGIHCHNDFGLAVANTIAGVLAGAEIVDAAVNGLGDRAGNVPLEEVVAALALIYELDLSVDLSRLTALSQSFAAASGRILPPNKPVSGPHVFAHVLPTHTSAIRRDSRSIQPFEPDLVGNIQRLAERPSSPPSVASPGPAVSLQVRHDV